MNDQSWSTDDGGFIYSPSESKAGEFTSYGSMSYAGLKSMIYAKVDKQDKRVKAVFNWVSKNYSVDQNPKMKEQGLYYYYHTMAKALNAYGEEYITDDNGNKHTWREEMLKKLLSIQNGEGWWQNSNNRWWENNKELVTAFTLLSIENILNIK